MSTTTHPLESDVRTYLRERWEDGNSYVKISMIAKAIDEDPRALTPVVRLLVHERTLEVWASPDSNANTYRIADGEALVEDGGRA